MSSSFITPEVPVSWGELVDKITILEIKTDRIKSPHALSNIRLELDLLNEITANVFLLRPEILSMKLELTAVNESLWEVEDKIREKESHQDFGDEFIALARAVYQTNDRRAAIKKEINIILQSKLVEEKSYWSS